MYSRVSYLKLLFSCFVIDMIFAIISQIDGKNPYVLFPCMYAIAGTSIVPMFYWAYYEYGNDVSRIMTFTAGFLLLMIPAYFHYMWYFGFIQYRN